MISSCISVSFQMKAVSVQVWPQDAWDFIIFQLKKAGGGPRKSEWIMK